MRTANEAWLETLRELLKYGKLISPRGMPCLEKLAYKSIVTMSQPLVTVPMRRLGYKFQAAEAAWILSGDNRVSSIMPYSKDILKFSDDREKFFGAYGPKFVDQIAYVARTLYNDPDSRQAVMNIWREQPPQSKDIPCTISIQWLIRDGKLFCFDTMRSSDIWLGWPYDIFNWTMATTYLALYLKKVYAVHYELADITLVAGSQHMYKTNEASVVSLLKAEEQPEPYPLWRVDRFREPAELVDWLWSSANNEGVLTRMRKLQ